MNMHCSAPRSAARRPRLGSFAVLPCFALSLLVSCSFTQFEASRDLHRSHPAEGVLTLRCATHNGPIRVRGKQGQQMVEVVAHLTAYGDSEEEALANVAALDVEIQREGNELVIRGIEPESYDWRDQSSFSYSIDLPPDVVLRLESHNGDIEAFDVAGNLELGTHNGGILLRTSASKLTLETHNGGIDVTMTGDGPVGGSVVTHNGGVDVRLGARAAVVEASTHNGSIEAAGGTVVQSSDDRVRFVAGEAGGALQVLTHNGAVHVSAGAK